MRHVVIVLDGLRADTFAALTQERGGPWSLGRRYTQVYAEFPLSLPSRLAWLTGRLQSQRQGFRGLRDDEQSWIPQHATLIGDTPYMLLSRYGFASRFARVVHVPGQFGDQYGDQAVSSRRAADPALAACTSMPVADEERTAWLGYLANRASQARTFAECCVDEALSAATEAPPLMWLDLFDTHEPWLPCGTTLAALPATVLPHPSLPVPSPEDELKLRALYREQARETLTTVERLLAALAPAVAAGELEVTLLSDHGTPLGEHLGVSRTPIWRKKEPSVFAPIARVAAWRWGAAIVPGDDDGLFQSLDLLAPAAHDLGAPLPDPDWQSVRGRPRDEVFTAWPGAMVARRTAADAQWLVGGDFPIFRVLDREELRPTRATADEEQRHRPVLERYLARANRFV